MYSLPLVLYHYSQFHLHHRFLHFSQREPPQEMTRAIERHEQGEARVIPLIVRPVFWQGAPFGKLQALPTDAKAVTSRYWPNPDEAFFDVAEGIYRAIQELTTSLQARSEIKPSQERVLPKASAQTPIQDTPPRQVQKTKEQWVEEGNRPWVYWIDNVDFLCAVTRRKNYFLPQK
jgi:hypothetical protein